jgi:hypothetical protein
MPAIRTATMGAVLSVGLARFPGFRVGQGGRMAIELGVTRQAIQKMDAVGRDGPRR